MLAGRQGRAVGCRVMGIGHCASPYLPPGRRTMETTRRAFLEQVGQGVLIASIGSGLTSDLGLGSARAADGPARLNFGKSEPLVGLLQETPPDKLLPLLVARMEKGTPLK